MLSIHSGLSGSSAFPFWIPASSSSVSVRSFRSVLCIDVPFLPTGRAQRYEQNPLDAESNEDHSDDVIEKIPKAFNRRCRASRTSVSEKNSSPMSAKSSMFLDVL